MIILLIEKKIENKIHSEFEKFEQQLYDRTKKQERQYIHFLKEELYKINKKSFDETYLKIMNDVKSDFQKNMLLIEKKIGDKIHSELKNSKQQLSDRTRKLEGLNEYIHLLKDEIDKINKKIFDETYSKIKEVFKTDFQKNVLLIEKKIEYKIQSKLENSEQKLNDRIKELEHLFENIIQFTLKSKINEYSENIDAITTQILTEMK